MLNVILRVLKVKIKTQENVNWLRSVAFTANLEHNHHSTFQQAFTFSKSKMETTETCGKYVQS